jgi:uncharacterized membrane protein YadS
MLRNDAQKILTKLSKIMRKFAKRILFRLRNRNNEKKTKKRKSEKGAPHFVLGWVVCGRFRGMAVLWRQFYDAV